MPIEKPNFKITCNLCGNSIEHNNDEPFEYNDSIAICLTARNEIVIQCKKCGNTINSL